MGARRVWGMTMGITGLDPRLEPVVEALVLLVVLLAVGILAAWMLNIMARRRRARRHEKLSGSRRMKQTSIDLFAKPAAKEAGSSHRKGHGGRRSRSSHTHAIDLFKRVEGQAGPVGNPASPPEAPGDGAPAGRGAV